MAYSRNHQTAIKTLYNDLILYNDPKLFTKKEVGGSIVYSYRPGLNITHNFEVSYRHSEVVDTIVNLNPEYFTGTNKETF